MAKDNPGTKRSAPKRRKRKWLGGLAVFGLLIAVCAGIAAWFAFGYYAEPYRARAAEYDLDRINDLERPSFILDRNGKEIGRIFVENRSVVPLSKVPERLINALIAGEDGRFWRHDGIDYFGIVRAAYLNWRAGGVNQGASTITQQLARNAYGLKEQARKQGETPLERKMVEAFLARRIEERYSKKEILEFYLNRIYFGRGYYGIRSASLGYFGKEPEDLSQAEAASLVGLIKNPSQLNPLHHPEENRKTRDNVLSRMVEEGMLKKKEARKLMEQPVQVNPKPLQRGTSHLYERVARELRERLGEEALSKGGFRIHTTIDRSVQVAATQALEDSLTKAEEQPGYSHLKMKDYRRGSGEPPTFLQGALLMIDHTSGEVLAHVGGRDFSRTQYDFVESGRRPLGTAFHPFIYTAGFLKGLTPATPVTDEAMDNRSVMVGGREGILGEWGMETAKPSYEGEITARRALAASKIAATVRFGTRAGLEWVREVAAGFGFRFDYGPKMLPRELVGWETASLPELVRAYAVFGRSGREPARRLIYVSRIEDADGRTVYRESRSLQPQTRIIDEATAFQVHSILNQSLSSGSAAGAADKLLQQPFHGGGKTGTTHNFSDNWFLGYNRRVSCGVWVGFLQGAGEPIYEGAFSRDLAMPVWLAAMNAALPSFSGEAVPEPRSIAKLSVCRKSGKRATRYCYESVEDAATATIQYQPSSYTEYFRAGTEPSSFCDEHGGEGEGMELDPGVIPVPTLRVAPIRPTKPVLLGEDPYFSERPALGPRDEEPAVFSGSPRPALERPDLGDEKAAISLPRPGRLEIEID